MGDFLLKCVKDTHFKLKIIHNNHRFHDRYIVVDFDTEQEKIFHCGASSKDAGKRTTTIMQIDSIEAYYDLIRDTLNNEELPII